MKLSQIISESLMMSNAKKIESFFHVDERTSKELSSSLSKKVDSNKAENMLDTINHIISGVGVEKAFMKDDNKDVAIFINTGSPENPTVVYDIERKEFSIESIKDWSKKTNHSKFDIR